jgi:hypothetical protein
MNQRWPRRQQLPLKFERFLRSIKVDKSHDHAEVLLLTCIDFRFFTLIAQKMNDEGLTGKYDHFILAGTALGATLDFAGPVLSIEVATVGVQFGEQVR